MNHMDAVDLRLTGTATGLICLSAGICRSGAGSTDRTLVGVAAVGEAEVGEKDAVGCCSEFAREGEVIRLPQCGHGAVVGGRLWGM